MCAPRAARLLKRGTSLTCAMTVTTVVFDLDEKGLEAQNLFAEEYVKMTKATDDPALEVDIYVFIK